MLLGLDLRLGREAHAHELGADALAELGLGQEQEVVVARAAARAAARSRAPSRVSSSASQLSPGASASTSFETIRWR